VGEARLGPGLARRALVALGFAAALFAACLLASASQAFPVEPDETLRLAPDNSALRASLLPSLLDEGAKTFDSLKRTYLRDGELPVMLALSSNAEGLKIQFVNRRGGDYPAWSQGSWVLTRSRARGGALMDARVYYRSDPSAFAYFRRLGVNRCAMDVYYRGALLARGLNLAMGLEDVARLPLARLASLTEDRFDWALVEPDPARWAGGEWSSAASLVASIRAALPGLSYADDGAQDYDGTYVRIADLRPQEGKGGLNCSGFAKWVMDGFYRAASGSMMSVADLKEERDALRPHEEGEREAKAQAYFGLDWARNLGLELDSALYPSSAPGLTDHDIISAPFGFLCPVPSPLLAPAAPKPLPPYRPHVGFDLSALEPLLALRAISHPGDFYLVVLSKRTGDPAYREYFHMAVLVPLYDERGDFSLRVFESAAETDFAGFLARHRKEAFPDLGAAFVLSFDSGHPFQTPAR
jgi:hypothetical protein